MKKILYSAWALLALCTSCQQEQTFETASGAGLATLRVSSRIDDSTTRSVQALDGYDLRYIAELWTPGADAATARQVRNDGDFSFENVDRDATYEILVWADYVATGSDNADLFYGTASLRSVTLNSFPVAAEAADAFCASQQVTANGQTVSMTLTRPFARLNVLVKDLPSDEKRPAGVEIVLTAPSGVNVSGGALLEDAELTFSGEVPAVAGADYNVAWCFVPAARGEQTVADPVIRLLDASSAVLRSNSFSNIGLQANYRTNLSYNAYSANLDVDVSIDDTYEDQTSYVPGDLYDADGVQGIVFQVDGTGRHGKIFSLTQTVAQWAVNEGELSVNDAYDGAANTAAILALDADADYPAFAWVRSLGEGWYLPAVEELFDLRYAFAEGEYAAGIQAAVETCGAAAFYTGADNCYWSSSEELDGGQWNARFVRFGVEEGDYVGNKQLEHYVRAIRQF